VSDYLICIDDQFLVDVERQPVKGHIYSVRRLQHILRAEMFAYLYKINHAFSKS
jgi:hypothetical protein